MLRADDPRGELPKAGGLRSGMLWEFHKTLCTQTNSPINPAGHRRAAPCWRALDVVDREAGDLDDVMEMLEAEAGEARRRANYSAARVARVEETIGAIEPAVSGEVI